VVGEKKALSSSVEIKIPEALLNFNLQIVFVVF